LLHSTLLGELEKLLKFSIIHLALYLPHIIQSTMVLPTMEVTRITEKQQVQMIWDTVQGSTSLEIIHYKIMQGGAKHKGLEIEKAQPDWVGRFDVQFI
jgi:hypothetical protein